MDININNTGNYTKIDDKDLIPNTLKDLGTEIKKDIQHVIQDVKAFVTPGTGSANPNCVLEYTDEKKNTVMDFSKCQPEVITPSPKPKFTH